jgi:hypothetical protein
MEKCADFYGERNAATRIDAFEELSPTALAALRTFARRIGAPHYVDEVILPTLQEGDCRIYAAVRDRPWPPWGLGARNIIAMCDIVAIDDESYAISPILSLDEEATNAGLLAALYKEVLEALAASPRAEVNYLVAEGSGLADHVLSSNGFKRHDDVFLTEQARYYTYRTSASALLERLGLTRFETPDLLAHELPHDILERNALFHQSISLGARPEYLGTSLRSELIRLVRGGHAGKPGGVPSGTGRWGYDPLIDPAERFLVSQANFLGERRLKLLDRVIASEKKFTAATIVGDARGKPAINEKLRRARTLDDLGEFERLFTEGIKQSLEPALKRLGIEPFPIARIEMQVTASGDGDYFRMHRDGGGDDSRVLSFVYFFFREPRRFSGGELRLFDAERVKDKLISTDRSLTLSPRQDMILFFSSSSEHEVLPVRVPSRVFADSRFTVNGWIHRR